MAVTQVTLLSPSKPGSKFNQTLRVRYRCHLRISLVKLVEGLEKEEVMSNRNGEAVAGQGTEEFAVRPTKPAAPMEVVIREVSAWEGVTVHSHRFGGVEFRVGRRELGHLHATIADLPFPRRIRDELIESGQARPHHVLPESGWVTAPMRTPAEVAGVIELFRQNYERAVSVK